MNNQPLISVIVPVYKVEAYIHRCVDSILAQTYKNLEIILVDDGSPDACGVICDHYADIDDRIRVIHKANGGQADARNVALDVAQGEYVTFVDSDDYISRFYIEHLWRALHKSCADMAISGFVDVFEGEVFENATDTELIGLEVIDSEQCLKKLLYQDKIDATVWAKLYRLRQFRDIRFPKGKIYEDIPVIYRCIDECSNIALVENVDYYYWQRPDSTQYMTFTPEKMSAVYHMEDVCESIKQRHPSLVNASSCRYFSAVCNILFQISDEIRYAQEKEYLWRAVLSVRNRVLFDNQGRPKARVAAALSYLGFKTMRKVYRCTQRRSRKVASVYNG